MERFEKEMRLYMEKICQYCKHFRLHYIKYSNGKYSPLLYGHCVKPRLKKRYAEEKCCTYYQEKGLP